MKILNVRGSTSSKEAILYRPVTPDDIDEMQRAGVDGITLGKGSIEGDRPDRLGWLSELKALRSLSIDLPVVPALDDVVLSSLECLILTATKSKNPLSTDLMPRLRWLEISEKVLTGALSRCQNLESVKFRQFSQPTLAALEGCQSLKRVKVNGRRTEITFGWADPPRNLQELNLFSLYPTSLDGLDELLDLRGLEIWANKRPERPHDLDFTVLARCAKLERLTSRYVGRPLNVDALDELPLRSLRVE